jgi:hypothetical protein
MPRREARVDRSSRPSVLVVSTGFFAGLRTGLVVSLTMWALLVSFLTLL